jgi:hypothetical protein
MEVLGFDFIIDEVSIIFLQFWLFIAVLEVLM